MLLNRLILLGVFCGGIFIDQVFIELCKTYLGNSWNFLSKSFFEYIIRNNWEYGIKPQFRINGFKKDFTVRFPSEINVEIDPGKGFNKIKTGKILFHG